MYKYEYNSLHDLLTLAEKEGTTLADIVVRHEVESSEVSEEKVRAMMDSRLDVFQESIDAGMNDMLRPSLYGAWMNIIEVDSRAGHAPALYDVVGPVCETGDFLGKEPSRERRLQHLVLKAGILQEQVSLAIAKEALEILGDPAA